MSSIPQIFWILWDQSTRGLSPPYHKGHCAIPLTMLASYAVNGNYESMVLCQYINSVVWRKPTQPLNMGNTMGRLTSASLWGQLLLEREFVEEMQSQMIVFIDDLYVLYSPLVALYKIHSVFFVSRNKIPVNSKQDTTQLRNLAQPKWVLNPGPLTQWSPMLLAHRWPTI